MRFTMFLLILILLPLTATKEVSAQEKCALNLQNAPTISRLRLGMTTLEAQTAVGGALKLKNKRSGEYVFFQNYLKNPAPAPFENARVVYLRFFDNKLYQIEIFYDEKTKEKPLEIFIAEQSAKFGLPLSFWKIEYGQARVECENFSIVADDVLNPRVELTDEPTRATVEAKRDEN